MASTKAKSTTKKSTTKKKATKKEAPVVVTVADTFARLVNDLKREGETRMDLDEVNVTEESGRQMLESAAYRAGFADKITIRKRKNVLTGKLDKE